MLFKYIIRDSEHLHVEIIATHAKQMGAHHGAHIGKERLVYKTFLMVFLVT